MKIIKKTIAMVMALGMIGMVGCKKSSDEKIDKNLPTVGVVQYLTHASLDNCTKGIKEALKGKANVVVQVGSTGSPDADCEGYAANMVAKKYDLIIGVATPAAMKSFSAVKNASKDIPVVFCAVSDPVAAKLVNSTDKPGNNCTGTCDALDIKGQLKLIKAIQPDIKKLGVIYTTTEANSISQIKTLETEAKNVGIEIVKQGINTPDEMPTASANIVSKVDAITNLTDNNVVENMSILLQKAKEKKIPVYGSEIEQVKKGCVASASLDYVALGKTTGEMAGKILDGAKASDTPVVTVVDSFNVLNEKVLNELGLKLPDSLKDIEKVG